MALHILTTPLAAIVAHVFNDGLVNLSVFDSNGTPFSQTSVPLVQEGEVKLEHAYFCEWMPYQVGQAAKQANASLISVERRRLAAFAHLAGIIWMILASQNH